MLEPPTSPWRRALQLGLLLGLAAFVLWRLVREPSPGESDFVIDLVLVGATLGVLAWTKRMPRSLRARSSVRASRKRLRLRQENVGNSSTGNDDR
jgi:hypothetical protein